MSSFTHAQWPRGAVTRATVLVLLGGLLAVAAVAWRAAPTEEGPRRPTDDAERLEVVPARAAGLDAGAPPTPPEAP